MTVCDSFRMQRGTRVDLGLLGEHIDSRRGWGAYVVAMTKVRRSVVAETDEFLTDIHVRLRQALQRNQRRLGR
jgi:hypothetical protein